MITLYLVRHCQIQQTIGAVATHPRNDAGLSKVGISQAHVLAEFFARKPIDLVLTSLFLRSQQTAEIVRAERTIPLFSSMSLNEYQLRDDGSGVETTDQATARSMSYLFQYSPHYEHIAVVAHNALLSTMRMRLLNLPFDSGTDAFIAEGACRVVRYDWKKGDKNWQEEIYFAPDST